MNDLFERSRWIDSLHRMVCFVMQIYSLTGLLYVRVRTSSQDNHYNVIAITCNLYI